MDKADLNYSSMQIIIAAFNEEEGIGLTIAEMQDYLGNVPVLVVDGNSTDNTVQVAKELGAQTVLQDGKGKGDALAKSLEYLDPNAKYVVITDADYTYPAEYIPAMIKILEDDPQVGMVCGNRFNGNIDPKALYKIFYIGNRLIAYSHNLLNGIELKDPLTGLRVVRAELLKGWKVKSKGFDIEVELNYHIEDQGYKLIEIPIQYRKRLGEKKLKPRHGLAIMRRILSHAWNGKEEQLNQTDQKPEQINN